MSRLLEAIEADAKERLVVPGGEHPRAHLQRFEEFRKHAFHRIHQAATPEVSGLDLARAHALAVDCILCRLIESLETHYQAREAKRGRAWTLVGVGGYGRGELNPCSDIDVVFLLDGDRVERKNLPPAVEELTGALIFDLGFKVGCLTRTVADCVEQANKDMQSKTALLEARRVCGDAGLFARLQKTVIARCVKGHEEDYLEARLADQEARREKNGDSPFMQEPNIKNGCGGLRDFQNLVWMTFVKYRTHDLADLQKRDLISAEERTKLEEAYDFLLRVRHHLHQLTGRPVDVLSRNYQPDVARAMGHPQRSLNLRVQGFMTKLYTHVGYVFHRTRLLERRLALLPAPRVIPSLRRFLRQRRHRAAYVLDGFKNVDGEAHPASPRLFEEDPARIMRAFRFAQQRGLGLGPDLEALICRSLGRVDAKFRADRHVRETFLAILNERGNVAPYVRAMHETGVLGRFLPVFARLTNHVQHEFYHLYTTDEHTLVCLEQLDRISGAKEQPFKGYLEIFQRVERPFVLYLALLLHDAGKAFGSQNHAVLGSRIAGSVADRLHLDQRAKDLLSFLIRHHLLMASVSQHRDIDDPDEVNAFVSRVNTVERLDLLTLHTFADSMGTGDKLWTGHKNALLWALYRQAHQRLASEQETHEEELRRREQLLRELPSLVPKEVTEDELEAHLALMPPRYLTLLTAKEAAADLALIHQFMKAQSGLDAEGLAPVTDWHHDQDRGYSQLKVATWDREGLFSKIAGVLTAARLNILSAEIFTRRDDVALDTFLVVDAASGALASAAQQRNVDGWLAGVLTGTLDLPSLLAENQPAQSILQPRITVVQIPPRVRFDNATSVDRTIIEVEAEDRVGLLYSLAGSLAELGLNIQVAKIATDRGAAIDTFYVTERDHGRIESPVRLDDVERRLKRAVSGL